MQVLRAYTLLTAFFAFTLPLIPVQALLLKVAPAAARRLPNWYHRQVCKLFGIRLNVKGELDQDRPVLLVANHTSWLDIPILSAVGPVSFVAKKEVASWPFVSWLARLQRSVFIDRDRRGDVKRAMTTMLDRLALGDNIVLFPEGTSSDGNRVLRFRSSLFAAAKPPERFAGQYSDDVAVQTIAIVYRELHGIPLGRADRNTISWYGDMDMLNHAWTYLQSGPINVDIVIGKPHDLNSYADRKDLAQRTEEDIRQHVMRMLRGLEADHDTAIAQPSSDSAVGREQPPLQTHSETGETPRKRKFR